MILVTSQIEIASSPARAREIFMDWPKMHEWTPGPIRAIVPAQQKPVVEKGDKIKVTLDGMTFNPTVLENNASEFKWRGNGYGLVVGDHSFKFEPSKTNPGQTTFVHSEEYSGAVVWMLKPFLNLGDEPEKKFAIFNNGFKQRVESLKE